MSGHLSNDGAARTGKESDYSLLKKRGGPRKNPIKVAQASAQILRFPTSLLL